MKDKMTKSDQDWLEGYFTGAESAGNIMKSLESESITEDEYMEAYAAGWNEAEKLAQKQFEFFMIMSNALIQKLNRELQKRERRVN